MSKKNKLNYKMYETSPLVRFFGKRRTKICIEDNVIYIQKGSNKIEINIEDIRSVPSIKKRRYLYDTITIKTDSETKFNEINYRNKLVCNDIINVIKVNYVELHENKLRKIVPIYEELINIIDNQYPSKDLIKGVLNKTNKALSTFKRPLIKHVFASNTIAPYEYLVNLSNNHVAIFARIKKRYEILNSLNSLIKPQAILVKKQLAGIYPRDTLINKLILDINECLCLFTSETNNLIDEFECELPKDLILEYKYLKQAINNREIFFGKIRDDYIEQKEKEHKQFFARLNPKLNSEQRRACIIDNDNNLIIAGAGTGKTSTMVAKGGYLVENNMCLASEILMVVFNHNARMTLMERNKKFSKCKDISIHTFHSLGRSITSTVYKQNKKKISKEMQLISKKSMSNYVRNWISQLMEDESYANKFVDYILWEQCTAKTNFDFKNQGEYYRYIDINRLHPVKKIEIKESIDNSSEESTELSEEAKEKITYKKERVRSKGEWMIVNYLFVNNVKYYYEYQDPERTQDQNNQELSKTDMPSIYLPDYNIYIEYFYLDIHGGTLPNTNAEEYNNYINRKRKIFSNDNCKAKLIECYHYELQKNELLKHLESKLLNYNVELNRLTDEELLTKLKEYGEYEKLSDYLFELISIVKGSCETDEEIYEIANSSKHKEHVLKVLELMMPLKNKYEDFLKNYGGYLDSVDQDEDEDLIDFCDMINIAIKSLRSGALGENLYKYKYILVDEFQDISKTKSTLIELIRSRESKSSLFCVGDDWQSIYRFAGSDIKYMSKFDSIYGTKSMIKLRKTFRFNNQISKFAESFIMRKGGLLEKELFTDNIVDSLKITILREDNSKIDYSIKRILNKIVEENVNNKPEVYILCRYNKKYYDTLHEDKKKEVLENGKLVEKVIEENIGEKKIIKEYENKLDIIFSTMHRSKGLEADYVIIIGLDNEANAPFPSEREDPVSKKIYLPKKESTKYAEERRLFYVAITRAKNKVYLIADFIRPSEFIREIIEHDSDKIILDEFEHSDKQDERYLHQKCPSCKSGYLRIVSTEWKICNKKYTKLICTNFGNPHFTLCDYSIEIPNESCNEWEINDNKNHVNRYLAATIVEKGSNYEWLCQDKRVSEDTLGTAKKRAEEYAMKKINKNPFEFYFKNKQEIEKRYNKGSKMI